MCQEKLAAPTAAVYHLTGGVLLDAPPFYFERILMTMKWWGKTVEYKFVMHIAGANKLFLSLLDSPEERAGDATLSSKNRWILIQFKKDKKSISDERSKFADFEAARAMQKKDLERNLTE